MAEVPTKLPSGVIHDIGYRHYTGPRESNARIALSLYLTGLRHVFGLGRSTRSKVLPAILFAFTVVPAVILVGVLALTPISTPLFSYAGYTNQVSVLVSIFAAAQAPVLFSRDLRTRSIVLYLARPLSSAAFAVTRWASLATACLIFILVPHVVLYVGGQLSNVDTSRETLSLLKAVPLSLLLAVMLAAITGLIASHALRRGFAVVGSILMLVVANTAITSVQYFAHQAGSPRVGEIAGLFSPWSLVNGLAHRLDAGVQVITPPDGALMILAYVLVPLALTAGCVALLVRRFAKAGR